MALELKGRQFRRNRQGETIFTLKFYSDGEDEALYGVPNTFRGMPLEGTSATEWQGGVGKYVTTATYKGFPDSTIPDDVEPQLAINAETREEPIENYRYRQALEDQFGAFVEDGRLKFPEKLPSAGRGGSGAGRRKRNAVEETNPFFGLTSYPVDYDVATMTEYLTTVPAAYLRQKGTIVTDLPSDFSYDGDATAWYVAKVDRQKQGGVWRVTRVWKEMTEPLHYLELMVRLKESA